MAYKLRPYQQECADFVVDELKKDSKKPLLLNLATGYGKCLAPDTLILMADGTTKKIKDVKVGEQVQGPKGPNTVVGTHSGFAQRYKVIPYHDEPFIVSQDHIMYCYNTKKKECVNKTIEELYSLKTVTKQERCTGGYVSGYRLVSSSVDSYTSKDLKIPPYILGIWLGDGTARDPNQITSKDKEVIEAWSKFGKQYGLETRRNTKYNEKLGRNSRASTYSLTGGSSARGQKNPVVALFEEYDLRGNKHIPLDFLTGDSRQRAELLAGLLDTDGYFNNSGNCEIVQKNAVLARQIEQLARGLGFAVNSYDKPVKLPDGRTVWYRRMNIRGDEQWKKIPFRLRRPTRPKGSKHNGNRSVLRQVFKIEKIDDGEYFGIQVDGDNLFLLHNNIIVHNSWLVADVAKRSGMKTLILTVSKELCEQDFAKLTAVMDGENVGMYSASWGRRETEFITVATVQSAHKHPELWEDYELIIADEVDSSFDLDGMFGKLVDGKKIIGVSGTCYGTQGSRKGRWFVTKIFPLHKIRSKSHGFFWQPVCWNTPEKELIDQGFLCPVKMYSSPTECRLLKANSNGSEYTRASIDAWVARVYNRIMEVIKGAEKHGMCKSGIIFMPSVASCAILEQYCDADNISAKAITSKTPAKVRDQIVADHKSGKLKWLINMGVATRGFDNPMVDCLVICRPTLSLRLHRQILGRGIRLSEGKKICNVLDLTENCKRWGGPEDVVMGKNGWQDTIFLRGKDISGSEISKIDVVELAQRRNQPVEEKNYYAGFTSRRRTL